MRYFPASSSGRAVGARAVGCLRKQPSYTLISWWTPFLRVVPGGGGGVVSDGHPA